MKVTGQLEWNDYYNAWKLENRQWVGGRIVVWLVIFGILGLAFFVVYAVSTNRANNILEYVLWFIPGLILAVLLFLLPQWTQRQQLKMAFDQDKRMRAPFDVEMSDTALSMKNEIGHSDYPWDYFRKWSADENVVLLYVTDTAPLILPRRILGGPEAAQFIQDRLAQNQVPNASQIKRRPLQAAIIWVLVIIAVVAMMVFAMPEFANFFK